jgi:hypothetical protein
MADPTTTDPTARAREVLALAALITPNFVMNAYQFGDLHGWCERVQARLLSLAGELSGDCAIQ